MNKKKENLKKTNTNIFTLGKNKPQENKFYNYYYNNINNLKEYKELLPTEKKDDDKIMDNNKGLNNQINIEKNSKKEISIKTINEQNDNRKDFKFSDEVMINKKYNYYQNLENKNDNGNENQLFEDLHDITSKQIHSYYKIRPNNCNNTISESQQIKIINYNYINNNNINLISDNTNVTNDMKNNNLINQPNIFNINNPNYFHIISQPMIYYPNYSNLIQFHNNNYNQSFLSRQYNIYNNNIVINFNDDKTISKMALFLIKTQSGCHFLKEKSIGDHKFANELLFPEIKNNLKEICCNFISNTLMKILLDILTYENINLFISLNAKNLYDICLTESGSRIFQKLIEKIYISPVQIKTFILILKSKNLGILIKSAYGNHLLDKFLSLVDNKENTEFIYNYVFNNFIDIVKDKYGVIFLQKCLIILDDEQRKIFYSKIAIFLGNIMKDCYGYYLILNIFKNIKKNKFLNYVKYQKF